MPDLVAGASRRQPDVVLSPRALTWQSWIDEVPRPGWANMAIDTAMLELAAGGAALFRVYGWQPACLSFGRNEPASRRYDRARIAELGIDVVRRPTGGRAVWHAQELTYAVAAPAAAFGDLRRAYLTIHQMLRDAVIAMGVPASLAPAGHGVAPLDSGACFASPAGGEVLVRGAKLVGSAQVRRGDGLLQHGSLLLAGDQELVTGLGMSPSASARCTTLSAALGRPVTAAEAASAVLAAARRWPGAWQEPCSVSAEVSIRAAVHEPLYRSSEWTWRR